MNELSSRPGNWRKFSGKTRIEPALLFLLPGFAGLTLFFLWPFLLSIWYAFMSRPVNGVFVGFTNFAQLLQNKVYLLGLKNTLLFIIVTVPLGMSFSLVLAMMIRRVKKKELFVLIFLIPLVIPSGSTVFFWKALFLKQGYINGVLTAAGFPEVDWLESAAAFFVIVLIFIWKNLGYNMVLFLAGLNNIPKEHYEAAAVDGAGGMAVFFRITLPGLLPMTVLITVMSVINSFKVFKETYLLTGNYPPESVYMLQHFMNNMFYSLNYQKLTTATCILVLLITLLVRFLLRFERRHGNET